MRTNTRRYVAAHGVEPKGFGAWWFEITFSNGRGAYSSEQVQATGTLTDAKRSATRQLKSTCGECRTIEEIEVMP